MGTVRTISEVLLIVGLLISLGVNITEKDVIGDIVNFSDNIYGCDLEDVKDMYCLKLSNVNVDGIQRNCYYNPEETRKYKICATGWYKLSLEKEIDQKEMVEVIKYISMPPQAVWECDFVGCIRK